MSEIVLRRAVKTVGKKILFAAICAISNSRSKYKMLAWPDYVVVQPLCVQL